MNITGSHFNGTISVTFGGIPAASFNVQSDSLIRAVIGAGASGNISIISSSDTASLAGFTFISQPVDSPFSLVQFIGSVSGTQVVLQWQAVNEQHVALYSIQSGADSISFAGIGLINPRPNSDTGNAYTFIDSLPKYPVMYYRLAITDSSGNISYSPVISISFSGTSTQSVKLAPNPAQTYIIVSHPLSTAGSGINIEDMSGRIIKTVIPLAGTVQTKIDLTGVPNGLITVIFTDGKVNYSQELLVNN